MNTAWKAAQNIQNVGNECKINTLRLTDNYSINVFALSCHACLQVWEGQPTQAKPSQAHPISITSSSPCPSFSLSSPDPSNCGQTFTTHLLPRAVLGLSQWWTGEAPGPGPQSPTGPGRALCRSVSGSCSPERRAGPGSKHEARAEP